MVTPIAIGQFLLQQASGPILDLIASEKLQAFGSTLVDPSRNRVVGYLQATDTLAAAGDTAKVVTSLLGAAHPISAPATVGYAVGKTVFAVFDTQRTAHRIEHGMSRLSADIARMDEKLDTANSGIEGLQRQGRRGSALQLLDIGINVASFAAMQARLDDIAGRVVVIDDAFREFQELQLKSAFTELKTLSRSMDEAWLLSDESAENRWREVASKALSLQDQFETRARDLLSRSWNHYQMAEPLLDAFSFANGLRVSALSASNETAAALEAASDGARLIDSMTGRLGAADLLPSALQASGVAPGTLEWGVALAQASDLARKIASHVRQREANMATRAAPLVSLEERGIRPRDWLAGVRAQSSSALIFLPHGDEPLPE
jgi:hypothetical protein